MTKKPLKELLTGRSPPPMKQSAARTPGGQPIRPMNMREFEYQKPKRAEVKRQK